MKIIGTGSGDTYICEVSHTEIEKFLNLYYGKMKHMKPGDDVDLGKGYQFHHDTMNALRKTDEFLQANKDVVSAITSGISIAVKGLESA